MRVAIAPVNVEAVAGLLDLVDVLRHRLLVKRGVIDNLNNVALGIDAAMTDDATARKWAGRIRAQAEILAAVFK